MKGAGFSFRAVAPDRTIQPEPRRGDNRSDLGNHLLCDLRSVCSPSLSLSLPICEMGIIPCPKSCPEDNGGVDQEACNMLRGVRWEEPGVRGESLPLTVVQGDDMEAVEELAFVLMNPLHLDVEE